MAPRSGRNGPSGRSGRLVRTGILVAVWALVTVVTAVSLFLSSSRSVVLASHDADVRPTLDGYAVVRTGPLLPDVRLSTDSRIGVDVRLGKTNARTTEELVERYAFLASQPDGQVAKVRGALVDMALAALLRGAALGLVPVGLWLLLGQRRRRQLWSRVRSWRGAVALAVAVVVGVAVWQPWRGADPTTDGERAWLPLQEYVGEGVPLPSEVNLLEVRTDVTAAGSRRLIQSAVDTYDKSKVFYDRAAEHASTLDLRQPVEGETVVVLVSDRHDNVGIDRVARAIADSAGANAVFDAGDDTSGGQSWEAFSLDSLTAAFGDLDRWAVTGNHDHGDFVADYLADDGWTMLDGEVVEGPGGSTLLGVDDPRSSGLGSWRDETGLSFGEVGSRLADAACAEDEPVGTVLVHDANLAREALERGCVDLVVGGHLHVTVPPTPVAGPDGQRGYTYTMGTTGGAAYALAVGSKPRRDATVSLLTYADGRPTGIQTVVLQTNGVFLVGDPVPLDLG